MFGRTVNRLPKTSPRHMAMTIPPTKNARVLAGVGAALLIPQPEATSERIAAEIVALLDDPARLNRMGEAARTVAPGDAATMIADELLRLARGTG